MWGGAMHVRTAAALICSFPWQGSCLGVCGLWLLAWLQVGRYGIVKSSIRKAKVS